MRLCIDGRYWQVLKSKVASCSTAAGGYLAKDERLQAHLCDRRTKVEKIDISFFVARLCCCCNLHR